MEFFFTSLLFNMFPLLFVLSQRPQFEETTFIQDFIQQRNIQNVFIIVEKSKYFNNYDYQN